MAVHPGWFSIVGGIATSVVSVLCTPIWPICLSGALIAIGWWLRRRNIRVATHIIFGVLWSLPSLVVTPDIPPVPNRRWTQKPVQLCGKAASVPRKTETGGVVLLNHVRVNMQPIVGRVRVTSGAVEALPVPGQIMCDAVVLRPIWPHFNPGVPDAARVWLRRGIRFRAHSNKPRLTPHPTGPVDNIRSGYRERIRSAPSIARAHLLGLILGDAGAIPRTIKNTYQRTGTSHLLAISGLHIGLLAWSAYAVSWRLIAFFCPFWTRRFAAIQPAAVIAMGVAWSYVFIAGSPPSGERAAWMVTALAIGRIVLRAPDRVGALAFAFACLLGGNPRGLVDPSIQLSFGAVTALIIGLDTGRKWLRNYCQPWPFRTIAKAVQLVGESLWVSTLCTLGTLPFVLYYFDTFAPLGLLTNLVAIPIAAYGLVVPGMLLLVLDICHLPVTIADTGLTLWAETACDLLSWVIEQSQGPIWDSRTTITIASVLAISIVCGRTTRAWRKRVWPKAKRFGLILILAATVHKTSEAPNPELHITFLDVGHGDCIVLQRTDGHAILIDAGGDPHGVRDPGGRVVVPALRALGVKQIDLAIISHAHPDHYGGLYRVFQSFRPQVIWFNGHQTRDTKWKDLRRRIASADIDFIDMSTAESDRIEWQGVTLRPFLAERIAPETSHWSANDASLVLEVRYRSFSALFTGDIESRAERALLPHLSSVDVLKVPHHGSKTSSGHGLIGITRPSFAVVQAEDGGHFGLPHTHVEERYRNANIPFWVTGRCGAVQVQTNGHGFQVVPYASNAHLRRFCSAFKTHTEN